MKKKCMSCGIEFPEETKFCSKCGKELATVEPPKEPTPVSNLGDSLLQKFSELNETIKKQDSTNDIAGLTEQMKTLIGLMQAQQAAGRKGQWSVDDADGPPGSKDLREELKERAGDLVMLRAVMTDARTGRMPEYGELKYFQRYFGTVKDTELKAAMDIQTDAEGADFIETHFSDQLIDIVRASGNLLANIPMITQPGNPYTLPVAGADPTVYMVVENTASTSQSSVGGTVRATDEITFAAKKLGAYVPFSYELEEDSVVPILGFVRDGTTAALSEAFEYCIIRGDETATASGNINKNDGTPTTTAGSADRYLAMDGICHLCIDGGGNSNDMATLATADILTLLGDLGKYAINPSKLGLLCNVEGYIKLLGLSDVLTADKMGPKATILTGQLASILGIPVLPTEQMVNSEDTNSGECIGTPSTTMPGLLLVYRPGVLASRTKRGVIVEFWKNELYQQRGIIVTVRGDVQFPYGVNTASYGYDID